MVTLRRRLAQTGSRFTLVELLVGMVILVLLMGMLFSIIGGAQKAYSMADSNAQTFERAHVLFEQISRDLRSGVACSIPGREIPVWVAPAGSHDPDPAGGLQPHLLCIVVAGDPYNDVGETRMNKVRYSFHRDTAGTNPYVVTRSIDPDRAGSPASPNAEWNFYGVTAANQGALTAGVPTWVVDSGNSRALIGGVEHIAIEPFPVSATGTRNVLPQAFTVTVTLVDERALALPEPVRTERLDQSRRTFRKVVFVGGEV